MRDITFRPDGSSFNFNYSTPVQEAQDHFAPVAANSRPPQRQPPQAPGGQQKPAAMPSMHAQLLRQFEAGPSNQPRQERVRHSATASTSLSDAPLTDPNQAMLAEFRQKADANPANTPLTKDYCYDVLVELADWLKQQPHYPPIRSLSNLLGFLCTGEPLVDEVTTKKLEKFFTSDGAAPARMGKPDSQRFSQEPHVEFGNILKALNLSRHEQQITLPPASASRQDERLLHAFRLTLLSQGTHKGTAGNNVVCFKHLCMWLHQQIALGKPIPYGLDSLEKLRDHPNENEVKEVIASFRRDPATTKVIENHVNAAFTKFRKLMRQPPAPATNGQRAQPLLQQLLPSQPEQPANLAPQHSSSLPAFTAEEIAFLSNLLWPEGDEPHDASLAPPHAHTPEATDLEAQAHGVRRPALWSQNEPRAVRPRLDDNSLGSQSEELDKSHLKDI